MILQPLPVAATGSISLHWQDCASVAVNRNAGSGPIDRIVVTLKGASGPIQAVQVQLSLGAGFAVLPPAWRFDPDGCQAGGLTIKQTAGGPACPVLLGTNVRTISGFDYSPYFIPRGRAYYFTAFDPIVADPGTTYTIAQFEFDHTTAISGFGTEPGACGCLDRPLCISAASASYLDAGGNEIPFQFAQDILTWNDPANSLHCGGIWCDLGECPPPGIDSTCVVQAPTPANARSWGSVKATYR
jgi:hypothetical protein